MPGSCEIKGSAFACGGQRSQTIADVWCFRHLLDGDSAMGFAMKIPRRDVLRLAAAATALSVSSRAVRADSYPSRPVHLIVGFPTGYATDIVAGLIAASLSERLGGFSSA